MKRNISGRLLLIFSLAVLVSGLCIDRLFAGTSSAKTINFLPREEKVESLAKDYATPLWKQWLTCALAEELQVKIDKCDLCVNTLKRYCPDCCLVQILEKNVKKCSEQDTLAGGGSGFKCTTSNGDDCSNFPFDVGTCIGASCPSNPLDENQTPLTTCRYTADGVLKLNGEHENWYNLPCSPTGTSKGCITGEPDINNAMCQEQSPGVWVCDRRAANVNNLRAKVVCNTLGNTCQECADLTHVYEETPGRVDCPAGGFGEDCYEYTEKQNLITCKNNCVDYARKWEEFTKKSYCCKQDTCSGNEACASGVTGLDNCCTEDYCNERIAWPECNAPLGGLSDPMCCNNLDNNKCTQFQNDMATCMDAGSDCPACFKEIDANFKYDFVARSREKLVVIWQIDATPTYAPLTLPPPSSKFYTMVKIFKVNSNGSLNSAPVHQSIVAAKEFASAFSIYAATSTYQMAPGFDPGEKYSVRLYYFIPKSEGYSTLGAYINRMEFIVFKLRE